MYINIWYMYALLRFYIYSQPRKANDEDSGFIKTTTSALSGGGSAGKSTVPTAALVDKLVATTKGDKNKHQKLPQVIKHQHASKYALLIISYRFSRDGWWNYLETSWSLTDFGIEFSHHLEAAVLGDAEKR